VRCYTVHCIQQRTLQTLGLKSDIIFQNYGLPCNRDRMTVLLYNSTKMPCRTTIPRIIATKMIIPNLVLEVSSKEFNRPNEQGPHRRRTSRPTRAKYPRAKRLRTKRPSRQGLELPETRHTAEVVVIVVVVDKESPRRKTPNNNRKLVSLLLLIAIYLYQLSAARADPRMI
jgi:hypothetical protein